ncbi:MAG: hypothetical protein GY932_09470 [Arcobacter sp.]|nr:hypothetical protein [Arcobacter sp.]
MNNCECGKKVFENESQCILHCDKEDYQSDRIKIGFLGTFYSELIDYITDKILEFPHDNPPTSAQIKMHLDGTINKLSMNSYERRDIKEFIRSWTIDFTKIKFPGHDSRDNYDYKKVLEKLGAASFNFCEFYTDNLDIKGTKLFFDECIFHHNWFLYNHKILETSTNVLYQICTFEDTVSTVSGDYDKPEIEGTIFSNCIFNKKLILEHITIKSWLFLNSNEQNLILKKIRIYDCWFEEYFIANNLEIESFHCEKCKFKQKFEFKENLVKEFKIDDTNFETIADFYKTSFVDFKIYKSIFYDYVGFEDCLFGTTTSKIITKSEFIYSIFMSFINFRNARFNNGLDLTSINIKGIPNFYNVYVSSTNTNRETFRRIKDSFDKVGNFIEANNFYALEMQKFKEELKNSNQKAKKYLLYLYEFTSNFGQSYVRPLLILLLSAILYWLIVLGYENNLLYSISNYINAPINVLAQLLNNISSSILPISKFLREGMEFISLVFYIIFSICIWLIILAIKRSTRR